MQLKIFLFASLSLEALFAASATIPKRKYDIDSPNLVERDQCVVPCDCSISFCGGDGKLQCSFNCKSDGNEGENCSYSRKSPSES
jgi:hypothetical protein